MSAGLLFVDLQSAYYAVIRETVLGGGLSDRPLGEVASALGLDSDDLQLLKHYAEDEPVLQQQDACPMLLAMARELHRQTWFVLAGDSQSHIVIGAVIAVMQMARPALPPQPRKSTEELRSGRRR
ncbi:hypothetical protein AK812_SmicGene23401 [Symbiodinium microadriaticum]|uniref:Uncharacterized protein n=1 Tax=Symbiodinium microadriaticum TaxID=2951 RepID=A0A1Q9DHJ1_SYMMI|nr:hypothetical protein AK812_SmicGene23401 [Symbiodinium microadriaticum]